MRHARNRLKNAELLSLLGACVASAGIALLLQAWLEPLEWLFLFGGLALHAAAMFYRRRLERAAGDAPTRWEAWLYGACWFILAALVLYALWVVLARSAA